MSFDEFIANLKIFRLQRHLSLDIWGSKDILKVHPFSLSLHPLLHDFHDELNILRQLLSSGLDGSDVSVGESIVDVGK
jgi:hypothetical protein